jgi:hypothetical protein
MMKTLEELREAVAAFRDGSQTNYDIYGAVIADCLLDPTPISKEVLEGMGFIYSVRGWRYVADNDVTLWAGRSEGESFWWAAGNSPNGPRVTLPIKPRTVGHLYSLLLRLSLQGESKGEGR